MLETIKKAQANHEKFSQLLLDELIRVAQPFSVDLLIDQSWNELFNSDQYQVDKTTLFEISIIEEKTINAFISTKKNIVYFNFIIEDAIINTPNNKIKITVPISKIVSIKIDDGIGHNQLNNIGYVTACSLLPEDIAEFRNI